MKEVNIKPKLKTFQKGANFECKSDRNRDPKDKLTYYKTVFSLPTFKLLNILSELIFFAEK